MLKFREFLKERLKNPEFKKEWDALEPEREETKRQLRAEKVSRGTPQAVIERNAVIPVN